LRASNPHMLPRAPGAMEWRALAGFAAGALLGAALGYLAARGRARAGGAGG